MLKWGSAEKSSQYKYAGGDLGLGGFLLWYFRLDKKGADFYQRLF